MIFLPICEDNFDTLTAHHGREYDVECNNICSRTDIDHSIFLIPCRKLTIYINKIKNNLTSRNTFESCKYLNYRINDELIRHKKNQTLADIHAKLINSYKEKNYHLNTICKENLEPLDENTFENVKKVFEIYNKFNKTLRSHSSSNNPKCSLINEAIDLYMKYGKSCSEQSNTKFCKALEAFKYYYQTSIGNINEKCTVEKYTLDSFQAQDSGTNEFGELQVSMDEVAVDETGSSTNYNTKKNMLTSFYILLPITFFSFILYKVNKYFIYIYEYSLNIHDKIL
ncbi:hypothetical protein PVMG_06051 [Plasmodium vivax Mauritania I]|uniref:Uncharacterized protein n=1 Tax=Plasmodium vivax Mauritania I TaxID=1035515 RepID=A0A0J9TH48_PLAVI|nr:hypothetical protein PVMG_06051 [Plasmodium vivax Mauritania I]